MKRKKFKLADGDKGIDQTVKHMQRLIRQDVTDPIVKKQAGKLKGRDRFETIKKTFNYVTKFKYIADPPGVEQVAAPRHLISGKLKGGDCDDLVTLLGALLISNQIPIRIKTIAWRRQDFTHVILEVYYNGYWIPMDPVKKRDGFGNQVRTIIREKTYSDPTMRDLVTLEDGPCSGCGSRLRRSRGERLNNIINIGNSVMESLGINPPARYIQPQVEPRTVQMPPVEPQVIEKPVPYPVYKPIKIPIRVIRNKGYTVYREWY